MIELLTFRGTDVEINIPIFSLLTLLSRAEREDFELIRRFGDIKKIKISEKLYFTYSTTATVFVLIEDEKYFGSIIVEYECSENEKGEVECDAVIIALDNKKELFVGRKEELGKILRKLVDNEKECEELEARMVEIIKNDMETYKLFYPLAEGENLEDFI